jgi:hypothetical protein
MITDINEKTKEGHVVAGVHVPEQQNYNMSRIRTVWGCELKRRS